jgi:hypothetical protein
MSKRIELIDVEITKKEQENNKYYERNDVMDSELNFIE